jgi:hypothetical protein
MDQAGCDVPGLDGVWIPGLALGWLFMDHDLCSGWADRMLGVVVRSEDLGVR